MPYLQIAWALTGCMVTQGCWVRQEKADLNPEEFFPLPSATFLGGRKGKGCQNCEPHTTWWVSKPFHHCCYHSHPCERVSFETLSACGKMGAEAAAFSPGPAFSADRLTQAKVNLSSGISLSFTTYLLSGVFVHLSSSMWFTLAEEEAGPK